MKKIIFILAMSCSFIADAQYTPPAGYTNINSRYDWLAGLFRALGIPAGGTAAFTAGQAQRAGALYYDSTGLNAGLYVYTGSAWQLHDIGTPAQLSTGLITGGALSINGGDNTKFDIAAGTGVYIDYTDPVNPVRQNISFGPFIAQTVTNIATQPVTYIGISSAGAVIQSTTLFTESQRRSIIQLGAIIHSNNVIVNAVNQFPTTVNAATSQLHDLMTIIGPINKVGNDYTPDGANLTMNKTAGEMFKLGANFQTDPSDPHTVTIGSGSSFTFRYRLQNSTEFSNTTNVDPDNYDLAGVLTAVPNNKFTIQRIVLFQSGLTRLQYGQNIYNSLAEAQAAISTESFIVEANMQENGLLRYFLILKKGTTNLNTTTDAKFIEAGRFGVEPIGGGGGSTPTLTQYRLAIGDASNLLSDNAAITGNRALISDANGVPTHSITTATEIGYASGVTSAIQTQINGRIEESKVGADFIISNDSLKSNSWINLKDYATGDGVTNDITGVLSAIATGKHILVTDTFLVNGSANTTLLTLNVGQKIFAIGPGAAFKTTSNARILRVAPFSVVENVDFIGSGSRFSGLEYQSGITFATNDTSWVVKNCRFYNLGGNSDANGGAIYGGAITSGPTIGGKIIDCHIFNSRIGILFEARAEYINLIGGSIDNCGTATYTIGGNNAGNSITIQNCDTAYKIVGGTNHAHSVLSSSTINHNTYNLVVDGVTLGQLFADNMFYAGNIIIRNSAGIRLHGDFSTGTITLTNNTRLYRSGKWESMTTNLVSGENFNVLGETTISAGAVPYIDQYSLIDTVRWRGPMFHNGITPASVSASDSLWAKDATTGRFVLRAQSDVTGGGGGGGDVFKVGTPIANQIGYWTGDGTLAGNSNFTRNDNGILVAGGTITTNIPVLDLTNTWNASGTSFTGIRYNATNTASAAASLLADLQVGGVSQFKVSKAGIVTLPNAGAYYINTDYGMSSSSSRLFLHRSGVAQMGFDGTTIYMPSTALFGFAPGTVASTAPDAAFARDAAGIIAQRNTTATQEFRIYNTDVAADDEFASLGWKNSSNVFQIATEKLSSGVERDLELVSGAGNTRLTKLAGSGTRIVVADASGNLSTQAKVTLTKNINLPTPGAAENEFIFFTPVAITVVNTRSVLVGSSTPSVTYNIAFGTDRTTLTNVYTAGQTVTSTTTGTDASGVNDNTIPANSWVILTTSAQSGTVTAINTSIQFTED